MDDLGQTNRVDSQPLSFLFLVWLTCTIVVEACLVGSCNPGNWLWVPLVLLGAAVLVIMIVIMRKTLTKLSQTHQELAAARITTIETSGTLEMIIDSIDTGMVMVDQTGQIQLVNQAFCTIYGKDKASLYGLEIRATLRTMGIQTENGQALELQTIPLQQVFTSGKPFNMVVSFSTLSDANWFSLSLTPVVSAATGSCLGALFSIRDITEQKTLEHLKDEFIGVVSHELKTPLTVVRGFAQLLKLCLSERKKAIRELGLTASAEALIPSAEENCLNKTLKEIDRMSGMLDQMVQITRIDSGIFHLSVSACDLAAVTQEVISRFQSALGAARIDYDPGEPNLQGLIDPNAYSRILANLISNAAKYSPAESPIIVRLFRRGQWACVSVADHGIGIPKPEQKTIFSKFYRTYAATSVDAEGLGLGLYITSRLAALQGGTIELTSEPGCGSTFEVSFPLGG